jgi:hypothetical protein
MNDLLNLALSAKLVLFGVFPVIIIGLGLAYAIKQWRDRGK